MAVEDWNWRLPVDLQDYPWDCAACSTAWCCRTVDIPLSEQDVIAGLGPGRISPAHGLSDASGAGLVSYLAEVGVNAANNPAASWQDCVDAAGFQPMVVGGRQWNHWVAVRMGPNAADLPGNPYLLLMNPSPGYAGVYQQIDRDQFARLGPFSAVWFESW